MSVEVTLSRIWLRWTGRVSRMEDVRLPKIIMYGELVSGHRIQGGQRK